jgi:hypothetical protein
VENVNTLSRLQINWNSLSDERGMKQLLEFGPNTTFEIDEFGNKVWRYNGNLHRENGPAYILETGMQAWYRHGTIHRDNGPAVIHDNGGYEWWLNGCRHRTDGPAIKRATGSLAWWLNGRIYAFRIWLDLTPINNEEKLLLKLQYG